jgi:anti-anti-sigma factor
MLKVEIVTKDDAVVCLPAGDLNATTATTFVGAAALCLGEPAVIIDLSGVRDIDRAGLVALVGAVRRAQEYPTRVAVVISAAALRQLLDEAGLGLIVSVSETVGLALAEIRLAEANRLPASTSRVVADTSCERAQGGS